MFDMILVAIGLIMQVIAFHIYTNLATLRTNDNSRRFVVAKYLGIIGVLMLIGAGMHAFAEAWAFQPSY